MSDTKLLPPSGVRSLRDLPDRLQKKISLQGGDERLVCWIWTGAFKRSRQRAVSYYVPDDYGGLRNSAGCVRNDRGMPVTRIRGLSNPVPAYRAVFAEAVERDIRELADLQRCSNDRCVSPHHTFEKNRVTRPRRARERAETPAEPINARPGPNLAIVAGTAPLTPVEALAALIRADVDPNLDPSSAAEEAGIETASVTDEVWATYISTA